jgi:APA family basic amino acid/polyamine antiporter
MDLVAIGIGGTVGSGLFVLAGLVSHEYAGPSAVLSWGVAGLAALLSGACYAELAARIPLPGGAFSYAYVAMGELAAVLVAACLSLEYIASSAAVARSWGDKVVEWLTQEFGKQFWIQSLLGGFGSFSPMAFLISTGTVALLLGGVKESKQVTNLVTGLKVSLCLFMIIAGFVFVNPANWKPFIPAQFGAAGVLRGATGTFFGYLGYDQVCSLGGEAINPKQDLPTAIMFTLGFVTVLYMIATLVLTGMQPYQNISSVSGFPSAFYSLDADLCGQITALGEVSSWNWN